MSPADDDESAYKYKLSDDSLGYVITCSGQNHALAGLPDNHPKYTTMEGLITGE